MSTKTAKSTVTLKTILKHVTSDGGEFINKADAQAHEMRLLRIAALRERINDLDLTLFETGDNLSGELTDTYSYLSISTRGDDYENVLRFLANNADLLLDTLTVKKPGGRKPKVPVKVARKRATRPVTDEPFAA